MSVNRFLLILAGCTLVCWLAWLAVLIMINPAQAGILAFLFFYLSLGFALVGTFSVFGLLMRWRFSKEEMAHKHMKIASRQSILFAVLILVAFFLQSQRLLTWWNLVILIVIAAFVELFFISYRKLNK
ncbi:hypothetical protein KKC32_01720 [Patescibacteria group bacterium]|nr:hypothetical protein [Patescibacteria group bacterium]